MRKARIADRRRGDQQLPGERSDLRRIGRHGPEQHRRCKDRRSWKQAENRGAPGGHSVSQCKGRANLHRRSRKAMLISLSREGAALMPKESWVITTAVGTAERGFGG